MIKRIIYLILTMSLLVTTDLYSLTGEEAVARFRGRMLSIGTMIGIVSWTHSSGMMYTGNFKYMAPGKIYIKFSSPGGKTIISNGKRLWAYNSGSNICGVQDLARGGSGGIAGIVNGYMAIVTPGSSGYTIKLKNNEKQFTDIILIVDSSFLLRRAMLKTGTGETFIVSLSNIRTGVSLRSGIFDFHVPANAQVVKNPLNIK